MEHRPVKIEPIRSQQHLKLTFYPELSHMPREIVVMNNKNLNYPIPRPRTRNASPTSSLGPHNQTQSVDRSTILGTNRIAKEPISRNNSSDGSNSMESTEKNIIFRQSLYEGSDVENMLYRQASKQSETHKFSPGNHFLRATDSFLGHPQRNSQPEGRMERAMHKMNLDNRRNSATDAINSRTKRDHGPVPIPRPNRPSSYQIASKSRGQWHKSQSDGSGEDGNGEDGKKRMNNASSIDPLSIGQKWVHWNDNVILCATYPSPPKIKLLNKMAQLVGKSIVNSYDRRGTIPVLGEHEKREAAIDVIGLRKELFPDGNCFRYLSTVQSYASNSCAGTPEVMHRAIGHGSIEQMNMAFRSPISQHSQNFYRLASVDDETIPRHAGSQPDVNAAFDSTGIDHPVRTMKSVAWRQIDQGQLYTDQLRTRNQHSELRNPQLSNTRSSSLRLSQYASKVQRESRRASMVTYSHIDNVNPRVVNGENLSLVGGGGNSNDEQFRRRTQAQECRNMMNMPQQIGSDIRTSQKFQHSYSVPVVNSNNQQVQFNRLKR
eukprot:CFRG0842T1